MKYMYYISVVIPVPNAQWIKLNHREVGYYRVNYTADMWELLSQNIQVT